MIHNSVGSNMFRNFYVLKDGELYDSLRDGKRSCAFFVSCILVIFKKIGSFHATVYSTVKDLKESGWEEVQDLKEGDVIVWEAQERETGEYSHIGFYIGEGNAVSMSDRNGIPIVHQDKDHRGWAAVARIYRLPHWEFGNRTPAPPVENAEML
jgi:hypothetical protein